MTTDLKAAAEAAKAATAAYIADPTDRETGRQWDRACAEFSLACTEDAILELIRERDEARKERDDLAQSLKQIMVADREAAEAALTAMTAERDAARKQVNGFRLSQSLDKDSAHVIRELLNRHNVPAAAFIDDHVANAIAQRDAAEAALASYKEEVERVRGALGTIADLHIPDQPAHFGGDELEWAQRHVGTLRRLAIETLTKEPPHAE